MRRVLVVGGWYPPCDRWPTAARRLSSLVKGLPAHGWAPTVLLPDFTGGICVCGPCTEGQRPDTADGVVVTRVPVRPTLLSRASGIARHHGEAAAPGSPVGEGHWTSLARTLVWTRNNTRTNWASVAGGAAGRVLAEGNFDAVLTTSGPFEHVAPIARLVRRQRIPWIADLRDPATIDVTVERTPIEPLVRFGRRAVCRALEGADVLIAATQQVVEEDRHRLGSIELLIPGFDQHEWSIARQAATPPARLEIVYAGQLYAEYRRPDVFLRGLRLAAERVGSDDLRLVYYGRDGAVLRAIAEQEGAADLVEDRGFVTPSEMPVRLASASALLLLTNEVGASGVPGGKFYEYLAAHRPLLAVPDVDRFVVRVLEETRAGVGASDEQQVAQVLEGWLQRHRESGTVPFDGDPDAIDRYSDSGTVERLAQLLDACHEGAGAR